MRKCRGERRGDIGERDKEKHTHREREEIEREKKDRERDFEVCYTALAHRQACMVFC